MDFKQRDAASYDEYAELYARHIDRLAGPLADHICRIARLQPGDHVLDVGCGTGLVALRAAKLVGPSGRVVGVDISPGMIEAARRADPGRVQFSVMDAEALGFEPGTFDAVISLFAVLHFWDISRAVGEMHRVLRPGGRLAVAFGYRRPISVTAVARYVTARLRRRPNQLRAPEAFKQLAFARLAAPEEPALAEWGQRHPLDRLAHDLREAGFEQVERSWRGHEARFASPVDFWEAQVAVVTEVRKRIASAPAEDVEALREAFLERARDVVDRGGELVFPGGAVFLTARARQSPRSPGSDGR